MRQKKCKQCGVKFKQYNSTQIVCSIKCSLEYTIEKNKKHKQKYKIEPKTRRELNRQDLRWQHKQTQAAFNKMRVLEELAWFAERGAEPTCISCGKELGGDQWCCGHFKTRGAQSGLRYDRKNTFLQHNHRCNKHLSGDIEGTKTTHGYKKGLIIRFGEKEGQEIIDYCEKNTSIVKWTWQELEEMRKEFNQNIKKLKISSLQ